MLQLIHLRCFVTVAAELHFGRAAARLNMSQPPLTRHIQLLEHELGVTLFDRDRRTVRLTTSGKAFLPEAEDILRRVQHAELTAKRARGGETGTITLGFIPAACYSLLPDVVAIARERFPGVDLVLKEMQTLDQIEALSTGRIDLGLVRPLANDRPGVTGDCILREKFVLALPTNHALASKRKVSLQDLDGQDFIMYSPSDGRYSYEMLVGPFRAATVAPKYVQYVSHTHSILSLVSSGMGLAIVPESAKRFHFENVVFKSIALGPHILAELFLVSRTEHANLAAHAFRETLLRSLKT